MTTPSRRPPDPRSADVTDMVKTLGALLGELSLTEIEVTAGGVHVRVQRAVAPAAAPAAPPPHLATPPAVSTTTVTIEAPMVGTFYRASSPSAEPFVREGDAVKEGQCLCIIEAMKLMNEIESKVAGRVVRILAENGQAVEYGQPLFLVDPAR